MKYALLIALVTLGFTFAWFFVLEPDSTPSPVSPPQKGENFISFEKFRGQDIVRLNTKDKVITLTFDGGGNAVGVENILEVLRERNTPATFFLTGKFIERFPDAVLVIRDSGGEIAHHSMTHRNLTTASEGEFIAEVKGMEELARGAGIRLAPFFRFPYGAHKGGDIELVNSLGYTSVRWTIDSLGWQGRIEGHDAQFVIDRVVNKAIPGAIILMHLGSARDGSTLDADALPEIIRALSQEGYRFVALSELFSRTLAE